MLNTSGISTTVYPFTKASAKKRSLFDAAFELAYFIHVNKEVAFFIAEDVIDALPLMLDQHKKNRMPAGRLRGFLKSGERTRPIRKTIEFTELQMFNGWFINTRNLGNNRLSEVRAHTCQPGKI